MIASVDRLTQYALSRANDDVIDGDEDELDEETNKPHHHKSDRNTNSHFREFFLIGFVALLDEASAILGEASQGIDHGVQSIHLVSAAQRERER